MLVNCPECNKRISDNAEACPNCGHPINPIKPKGEGCFLQTLNIGCATVLIGFVIVFLLAMAVSLFRFSPNKSEKTEIKKSPNK
ncbi:zinc ribbon protein [Chryseobacterium sp. 7]|uniref:zinc-ribbon domain-containing protein n=1 Tax=Chryseobacterium sp. 7 TaxID=2035214 RepID=UPI000EABF495|nr:zinc-ribbon domain-containing protein [Chryseobacterium sp. 7]RLJ22909.1 zinc ribbon protein [Chryseobacterium sp. 7]